MRRLILLLIAALGLVLAPLPVLAQSSATETTCTGAKVYDATSSGSTVLVTGVATGGIYVCGYTIFSAGGGSTVKFIYGTGTTCGTGTVSLTPAYPLSPQVGIVDSSPYFRGMYVPPSNDLCINVGSASSTQAIVYYSQFR